MKPVGILCLASGPRGANLTTGRFSSLSKNASDPFLSAQNQLPNGEHLLARCADQRQRLFRQVRELVDRCDFVRRWAYRRAAFHTTHRGAFEYRRSSFSDELSLDSTSVKTPHALLPSWSVKNSAERATSRISNKSGETSFQKAEG